MRVLGIETSCDETGIAIIEDGRRIIAAEVASQIDVHAAFGGVVPEIASRQHTECIHQLTNRVLEKAGGRPDVVAATHGPGLMGSLLVGVNFAKALAYTWRVPYVPVHHIEGHIFSVFLAESAPEFPFLALIVSGGHTLLIRCDKPHQYELLGTTRDDAIGECFDKVARLLHLPYPGGPSIQRAAETGDAKAIAFPRAMPASDSLEFSYSGLKTAVLYKLRENGHKTEDVAASFQYAAVEILIRKTRAALEKTGLPALVVAGGVAANKHLRERLAKDIPVPVFVPPFSLCVDNGAMIAAAGHSLYVHGKTGDLSSTARASWPIA